MALNSLEQSEIHSPTTFFARMKSKRVIIRLAGSLLLVIFLLRLNLNFGEIYQTISKVNYLFFSFAVFLIVPILFLKALRWSTLLHNRLPYTFAVKQYALGLALGSITPGQVGDFLKVWEVSKRGYSLNQAIISTVLDRLFDIAILILLSIVGAFLLGTAFTSTIPTLSAGLVIVGMLFFIVTSQKINSLITSFVVRASRTKFSHFQATFVGNKLGKEAKISKESLLISLLITLFTSILAIARVWFSTLALGMNLEMGSVVAISTLSTVATLLPISIAGIGSRDLILLGILGQLGYSGENAVSLSILILIFTLFNLPFGILVWKLGFKE